MAGLLISALALWLVLRQMQWDGVKETLRGADLRLVVLACLLYPWRLLLISQRWGGLLGLYGEPPPFWVRLRATAIGYLANNVLPFRSGDVIRGGIVVREGASLAATASTLVLEKIIDLWVLVGCLLIFGSRYLAQEPVLTHSFRILGILAGVSFVIYVAVALTCDGSRILAWLERFQWRGANLAGKLVKVLTASCQLCHRPKLLGSTILTTGANWAIEASFSLLMARALGIPLTYQGALFLIALVGLGLTIPSSPGGIGLSQFVVVAGLKLQGVEVNAATAFALLGWVVGYLCMNLVGVVFLLVSSLGCRVGNGALRRQP